MGDLLIDCLLAPARTAVLTPSEWELLICRAEAAGLPGRLLAALEEAGVLEQVPAAPRRHLEWSRVVCQSQGRAVRREVGYLREALGGLEQPVILLKGAAYAMADLPVAEGRLFGDVDILVARAELSKAEALLKQHGWVCTTPDPYDQRYYREWGHELPPLRHRDRGTVVDVHHGLLPPGGRRHPDAALLRAAAQPIPDEAGLYTLAPADMVLHAAGHLFHEGEYSRGLRNLVDLDCLLRHFGPASGFWEDLLPRARVLDLSRPLHYALRYCRRLLATPIPPAVLQDAEAAAPPRLQAALMDRLFTLAFCACPPDSPRLDHSLALSLLYLRGHALRMPPGRLIPHLARKSWRALLVPDNPPVP